MWAWLEELWQVSGQDKPSGGRRLLHRRCRLSGAVINWLRRSDTAEVQRLAFVELLLKLDSDPVAYSEPVLHPNALPGMRWAPFDAHKVIFVWNLPENQIHVLTCI